MASETDVTLWGVPRWVVLAILPLFITGTGTACGWMWSLQTKNSQQDETLATHNVRIDFAVQSQVRLEGKQDRLESKIDRLIDYMERLERSK